jgi:MFS transporter, UMF1 family
MVNLLTADPKLLRAKQRAWCIYDWANSVYSLVITTTIFPLYYVSIGAERAKESGTEGMVTFFGFLLPSVSLYSYAFAAANLTTALISPALAGIADATGLRKVFWQFFCFLGAASCACLYFFTADTFSIGIVLLYLASVGFAGSLVFYNSYLPDLALPKDRDRLSALGYSYGYVGSFILQVLCLLPILMPVSFGGISAGMASRLSFVAVGIWWAGFALISFNAMPADIRKRMAIPLAIKAGFSALHDTIARMRAQPGMVPFLAGYLYYNMGVQTIMVLASLFGAEELKLPSPALIGTILGLQLVAIPGALLTARASSRFGNIPVLATLILVWIGVSIGAYYTYTANQFYALALVVGIMMGGIQSLSRATWSKLIPETDTAHETGYFSLLDVTDKLSIVGGTLVYGILAQLTGSMRISALGLGVFFVIGLIILLRGRIKMPVA